MPSHFTIRPFLADDFDHVVALWKATEGVEVAEGDSRSEIVAYLQRNPNLSLVAEAGSVLAGAVLCGHDGRRGLIYHLAVAPAYRGQEIGRALIEKSVTALREVGIKRVLLLVSKENGSGQAFWLAQGFEQIGDAIPFGRDVL